MGKLSHLSQSEADIQAEFYHQCRLIGLGVKLELSTPMGRLDVAVMNKSGDGICAIVECKKSAFATDNTWQMTRYRRIGVPVYLLKSSDDASKLADDIKKHQSQSNGVGFELIRSMKRFRERRSRGSRIRMRDVMDNLNIKRENAW